VGLLRIASVAMCLIVAASFITFAVNETKSASKHQQEQVAEGAPGVGGDKPVSHSGHEGSLHRALDDTAETLTSPFAGLTSASSEWATRGLKLFAALLVYGFGLGYLARLLRVRL
jgi:hypothetical protein